MDPDVQIFETSDIRVCFIVNMDIYIRIQFKYVYEMDVSVFVFEVYSLSNSTYVSNKNMKYLIISVSEKYKLF